MSPRKLIDVVTNLSTHDPEFTIYPKKPWMCDSLAVVAREPDEGGVPNEAELLGAEYFMEGSLRQSFWTDGIRWTLSPSPTLTVAND